MAPRGRYDFGAGLAFNTLVNSFIGDTLFSSFVAPFLGRHVSRYLARKEPTQYLMDEACRAKDSAYLPWRIVHLIKAWFFAVVLMPVVPFAVFPLVVYHALSFVVDRYNMLCALEPLPPSSGLCMRFVLTICLPCVVPLHFLVGIIGFRHAIICGDRDAETAAFRGCVRGERRQVELGDWSDGTAELLTYVAIGAVLNSYLFIEIFYLQRRQALRLGLMTPYQVFKAGFVNDRGFGYASASEPYRFVDVKLSDVDLDREHMEEMYTAEVLLRTVEERSSTRSYERATLQPSASAKKLRVTLAKGDSASRPVMSEVEHTSIPRFSIIGSSSGAPTPAKSAKAASAKGSSSSRWFGNGSRKTVAPPVAAPAVAPAAVASPMTMAAQPAAALAAAAAESTSVTASSTSD